MIEDDRPQFARDMFMMASGFNAPMNDLRIELYFAALKDLEIGTIEHAITVAVNRCKFCPTIAEIREVVNGSQTDRAELAWLTWKELAHKHGAYTSLEIADPAFAETILAVFGSWASACSLSLSDEMWAAKRKEFERVFRVMEMRELTGSRRLAGIAELQNTNPEWAQHTPVAQVGSLTRKQLT